MAPVGVSTAGRETEPLDNLVSRMEQRPEDVE